MKKTLRWIAVLMFMTALATPVVLADGMPNPSCPTGRCRGASAK